MTTTVTLLKDAEVYQLSAETLRAQTMLCNGKALLLDENNTLPEIDPVIAAAGELVLPAATCTFIVRCEILAFLLIETNHPAQELSLSTVCNASDQTPSAAFKLGRPVTFVKRELVICKPAPFIISKRSITSF